MDREFEKDNNSQENKLNVDPKINEQINNDPSTEAKVIKEQDEVIEKINDEFKDKTEVVPEKISNTELLSEANKPVHSSSKVNEEIFEANRLREEEKLREKIRKKENKRRAKAILKEERRKTKELTSSYKGHRVAIIAIFLAAIFFSGLAGGSFSYFYMQSEIAKIREELKLDNKVSEKSEKDNSKNDSKTFYNKDEASEGKDKDVNKEKDTKSDSESKDVSEFSNAKAVTPDPNRDDVKTSAEIELSTPAIAQAAIPAVVAIFTENTIRTPFGDAQVGGAGSGVIIDPKGYVVTNNHVVESGGNISVKLANGDKQDAEIVATDPSNDIAVLKISGQDDYPYIEMADSDTVVIGERAIAIGNPLGNLEGTVTSGIVSAMGREVSTKSEVTGQVVTIENAIQTDASINSGNSGGALLNAEGKLIGINSVKASTTSNGISVDGIGFAIPSNHVKEIASRFINYDENGRPSFGIVATPLSEEQVAPFGFPAGILVRKVTRDSGADKAGLKVNDIITEVDGQKVSSIVDMNSIKVKYSVGDVVKIKYFRNGEEKETDLELSKLSN